MSYAAGLFDGLSENIFGTYSFIANAFNNSLFFSHFDAYTVILNLLSLSLSLSLSLTHTHTTLSLALFISLSLWTHTPSIFLPSCSFRFVLHQHRKPISHNDVTTTLKNEFLNSSFLSHFRRSKTTFYFLLISKCFQLNA